MRTILEDTFVTRGQEYVDAGDRIFILNQPISTRHVWRLKLFALLSIIPAYLLFAFLFHGWFEANAWTASALAILICVNVISLYLVAYVERQVGYWKLSFVQGHVHTGNKQRCEWRFMVA